MPIARARKGIGGVTGRSSPAVFNDYNEVTMSRLHAHSESHLVERIGWLRAAVLGANDGIVSTASLIVGVAAALVFPVASTFTVAVMVGWLLVLSGAVTIFDAFTVEGTGPFFWE